MSRPIARRQAPALLSSLAWLNVVTHLVAIGFSALAIAPGNAVMELTARLNYLAWAPLGSRFGWGCWMFSALALVAFFAAAAGGVAIRIPRYVELARLAAVLACRGGGD